jgi:hypothetical protein
MALYWNGVYLDRAPVLRRKTSPWAQINEALEHWAIPAIWPCLILGSLTGLQFA